MSVRFPYAFHQLDVHWPVGKSLPILFPVRKRQVPDKNVSSDCFSLFGKGIESFCWSCSRTEDRSKKIVAFSEGRHVTGIAAKERHISNTSNTITSVKRYMGLEFIQNLLQQELILHSPVSPGTTFCAAQPQWYSRNCTSVICCI